MIVSVHIVDTGLAGMPAALRRKPLPEAVRGLLYAETTVTARQGGGQRLPLFPGRFGLIAAWQGDDALDDFLRSAHPLAGQLAAGWHTRLEPLRVSRRLARHPRPPRASAGGRRR